MQGMFNGKDVRENELIIQLFGKFGILQLMSLPSDKIALEVIRKSLVNYPKEYVEEKINHFSRVSKCLKKEDEKIVAVFHDGIESFDFTTEQFRMLGCSEKAIEALEILASNEVKYPTYDDYIKQVINSKNAIAIRVKFWSMMDKREEIKNDLSLTDAQKKEILKIQDRYIIDIAEALREIDLAEIMEKYQSRARRLI